MSKKFKDIQNMDEKSRGEKLREMKLDLIKKNVPANKANKGKAKEIKKTIARLLTLQKIVQTKQGLEKK